MDSSFTFLDHRFLRNPTIKKSVTFVLIYISYFHYDHIQNLHPTPLIVTITHTQKLLFIQPIKQNPTIWLINSKSKVCTLLK